MSNIDVEKTAEVAGQEVRLVRFYATRGAKMEKIETAAKTWGELRTLAEQKGYEVSKLHAQENVNKADLVHVDAVLPAGPFTVFFSPKETKSGADRANASSMKYKELKDAIKEDKSNFGDHAGEHYGNYTQMTTAQLQEKYGSYVPPVADSTPAQEAPAQNVADIVESVAQFKTQGEPVNNNYRLGVIKVMLDAIAASTASESVHDIVGDLKEDYLGALEAEITADTSEYEPTEFVGTDSVDTASKVDAVAAAKDQLKKEQEEAAAKEAEEKARKKAEEEEEKKALAEEASNLAKGRK